VEGEGEGESEAEWARAVEEESRGEGETVGGEVAGEVGVVLARAAPDPLRDELSVYREEKEPDEVMDVADDDLVLEAGSGDVAVGGGGGVSARHPYFRGSAPHAQVLTSSLGRESA
jgi:hypothetical protein